MSSPDSRRKMSRRRISRRSSLRARGNRRQSLDVANATRSREAPGEHQPRIPKGRKSMIPRIWSKPGYPPITAAVKRQRSRPLHRHAATSRRRSVGGAGAGGEPR
jgi:hypothetical protein